MIAGIVLAAGESRRMGGQKLLLPYGPLTMIEHVVDQVLHSDVAPVIIVVGHEAETVIETLGERPVDFVTNPNSASQMLTSIRYGLEAAPGDAEAYMVFLGDNPAITTALIDEILRAYAERGKGIVVPTYRGERGHPVLFAARYREEVLTDLDTVGLRGLIEAHPDDLYELPAKSDGVIFDIDTPEDYEKAQKRLEKDSE